MNSDLQNRPQNSGHGGPGSRSCDQGIDHSLLQPWRTGCRTAGARRDHQGMGDQDAVRRLSPRRWRILSYLAQHGSASTLDVALVCAVSRLTAHRDLVWLHESGLVRRERSAEDRTHTWWYGVTAEGTEVLRHALTESGRPVPLLLGQRPSSAPSGRNDCRPTCFVGRCRTLSPRPHGSCCIASGRTSRCGRCRAKAAGVASSRSNPDRTPSRCLGRRQSSGPEEVSGVVLESAASCCPASPTLAA